jgi:hypothetical protein
MRRAITEWGLVLSGALTVVLGLIWVDSLWLQTLQEPLSLGPDCFLRAERGRLCFFSSLRKEPKPGSGSVDRPTLSWVRRYTIWYFPGLEYHHRLLASGQSIWSLDMALVVPLSILLTTMAILWRIRWGRWRIRGAVSR